ncbi:MAG: peptide chain release factor N(5)-glutamine methyltransferase [Xanthomonadales bacterium]|nr:peptide chain release factor N(5)-glutamine methyltransferase [Xanthomonadales bacterium]
MSALQSLKNLYQSTKLEKREIDLVICHVLNINTAELYIWNQQLEESQMNQIQEFIKQRENGKPLAYITGHKEFWSLDLIVNENTLIPRPETELIIETVLELTDNNFDGNILDLGTGTGAIALSIAKERPQSQVTAVDYSSDCVETARKNQIHNQVYNAKFLQSNWFSNLEEQQFDIIVSNPPYVEENDPHLQNLKYEPITALTSPNQGFKDLFQIISEARNYLKPNGYLILEHGYNQHQKLTDFMKYNDYSDIKTLKDLALIPRVTIGRV